MNRPPHATALGFPAFPPGRRRRSRWGTAWITAVEGSALDPAPLRFGRRYATGGRVGSITIGPGRISATVQDTEPYHTVVHVEPLSDRDWDLLLDRVADKAGHIAALLDRDVPADLARADAGLVPGPGDLEPECECPGWDHPCEHAAAVCYQTAWLLDDNPFLLFLLRGRGERELQEHLRRRNGPSGPTLRYLVTDAAQRARDLLAGRALPPLTEWQDTVRWAAGHPALAPRLAQVTGRDLDRAIQAWRFDGLAGLEVLDGLAGLEVLERTWRPGGAELARARAALAGADMPGAELTVSANHWTAGEAQVRHGSDGRWYPYRLRDGEWWPAGPSEAGPVAALAVAASSS